MYVSSQVYTLKAGISIGNNNNDNECSCSWRKRGLGADEPSLDSCLKHDDNPSTQVNGKCHWLVGKTSKIEGPRISMIAFDMLSETLSEVPLPEDNVVPYEEGDFHKDFFLSSVKDHLCFGLEKRPVGVQGQYRIHLWMLQNHQEEEEEEEEEEHKWYKLFELDTSRCVNDPFDDWITTLVPQYCCPASSGESCRFFVKVGGRVFLLHWTECVPKFVPIDPQSCFCDMISYVPSLVSPF